MGRGRILRPPDEGEEKDARADGAEGTTDDVDAPEVKAGETIVMPEISFTFNRSLVFRGD